MKDTTIDITDIPFIDSAKYKKFKEEGKKECIWGLDDLHHGMVGVENIFSGQVKVPICERHYTWHCAIVTLIEVGGMNMSEVLGLSRELCVAEMIKRGLIPLKA